MAWVGGTGMGAGSEAQPPSSAAMVNSPQSAKKLKGLQTLSRSTLVPEDSALMCWPIAVISSL